MQHHSPACTAVCSVLCEQKASGCQSPAICSALTEELCCGGAGAAVSGSPLVAERLSQVPVQAPDHMVTIFPNLDQICDVSRQRAEACCQLKTGHRSAEETALL